MAQEDYGGLSDLFSELTNSTSNCTPIPDDFFDRYANATASHSRQIGVSVGYGIICGVGLIANAAVLFLLLTGGKKGATFKAPSTIFIMNLAIADILFLLTLPFSMSHRLDKGWKFGSGMCKFEEGVKFLNYYGSVFFITAMAVDRCLVVTRPRLLIRKLARKYMCIASLILWCLALIAVIPLLVFAGVDEHGFCTIMFPRGPTIVHNSSAFLEALRNVECIEDYAYLFDDEYYEGATSDVHQGEESSDIGSGSVEDYVNYIDAAIGVSFDSEGQTLCRHPQVTSLHAWLVWNFVIGFVVPFFIISLCYARMMMTNLPVVLLARERQLVDTDSANNNIVRESNGGRLSLREDASKLISQPEPSNTAKINQRAKILMNILVPCLIAAFVICWFPYHLFHLLQIKGVTMSSDAACHITRDVTFCLAFFNSALNPILNSFFLYNFKQRLHESKTWVSSQLKSLSSKKKRNSNEQAQDSQDNLSGTYAGEATIMTSVSGNDGTDNV